MEDGVGPVEQGGYAAVREIGLDQLERVPLPRPVEVALLQLARVVLGEAIHADDVVAVLEQPFAEVRSEEPGGPRDEHARSHERAILGFPNTIRVWRDRRGSSRCGRRGRGTSSTRAVRSRSSTRFWCCSRRGSWAAPRD